MGIVIVSTYPDKKSISRVSHIVVEKKLAACVNYTKINSVYAWKNKIQNTTEFLALFKTTIASKQKLKETITRTHPYEIPEIVELKMDSVSLPYMQWLEESTLRGKPKKRNNSAKR